MEYEEKQSNSESSTDQENDDQPEKSNEVPYFECIFCKRGFTNAQALGGHMNIHRKDRAKSKQKSRQSYVVSSKSHDEEVVSSTNYERFPAQQSQYYATPVEGHMNNYHHYPFPGSSNPTYISQGYYDHLSGFVAPRQEHMFGSYEDQDGPNLSMGIDRYSDHHEDGENRRNTWEEDEVDLELRLG